MYVQALLLYRQGRFAEAEERAMVTLRVHGGNAYLWFLLAMTCQRQTKHDEANCWLSQAEDLWQQYDAERRDHKPTELTWWGAWHELGWLRAEATELVNGAAK